MLVDLTCAVHRHDATRDKTRHHVELAVTKASYCPKLRSSAINRALPSSTRFPRKQSGREGISVDRVKPSFADVREMINQVEHWVCRAVHGISGRIASFTVHAFYNR